MHADVEELSILLGIKPSKAAELSPLIPEEPSSFLSKLSILLNSEATINLLEAESQNDFTSNEAYQNFTSNVGIANDLNIQLNPLTSSTLGESLKGEDSILKNAQVFYSKDYTEKIKTEFKEEMAEDIKPIKSDDKAAKILENEKKKKKKKDKKDAKKEEEKKEMKEEKEKEPKKKKKKDKKNKLNVMNNSNPIVENFEQGNIIFNGESKIDVNNHNVEQAIAVQGINSANSSITLNNNESDISKEDKKNIIANVGKKKKIRGASNGAQKHRINNSNMDEYNNMNEYQGGFRNFNYAPNVQYQFYPQQYGQPQFQIINQQPYFPNFVKKKGIVNKKDNTNFY